MCGKGCRLKSRIAVEAVDEKLVMMEEIGCLAGCVAHGAEESRRKGDVFLNALAALATRSSSCNLWSSIAECVC